MIMSMWAIGAQKGVPERTKNYSTIFSHAMPGRVVKL